MLTEPGAGEVAALKTSINLRLRILFSNTLNVRDPEANIWMRKKNVDLKQEIHVIILSKQFRLLDFSLRI